LQHIILLHDLFKTVHEERDRIDRIA
jgi:hypothetical protein